jgi:hypothetical protein
MIVEINPQIVKRITIEPLSSLIESLTYDQSDYTLSVKYKSGTRKGSTHKYTQISLQSFLKLLESESIGKSVLALAKNARDLEQHGYSMSKPLFDF